MFFKKKAFSLAEILWAVALLGVVIVTITGVFTGIFISSKKNDKLISAISLATKEKEYIKLMGSSDIPVSASEQTFDGKISSSVDPDGNGVFFPPYPAHPAPLYLTVNGVKYYYKITTSYVPSTGDKLINIVITVYWDDTENAGKNFVSIEMFKEK